MHYIKAAELAGGWRGRQTVHSSVKLYCKIRRSTVPDTLRGTQSSFADVLKFKFFILRRFIYTRVHWLPGRLLDRCVRRRWRTYNTIYMRAYTIYIIILYMNIYRNSVSHTRKGHANAALPAVFVPRLVNAKNLIRWRCWLKTKI